LNSVKRAFAAIAALALCICQPALAWNITRSASADLFFAPGSDVIDSLGLEKLRRLAESTKDNELQVVIAVGHASQDESDADSTSQKRADAARFELIQLGFPPRRIFIEGKGTTQPLENPSDDRQRRVEIEYVGTHANLVERAGLSTMSQWYRDMASGEVGVIGFRRQDRWDGMTPLQFLPFMTSPELRASFLKKYRRVAIAEKDDALLKTLQELQGPSSPLTDAHSALLAAAFGTSYAQSVFADALSRLNLSDPEGQIFAGIVWCDERRKSTMERTATLALKIRQMLPVLPPARQLDWVSCAARRGDEAELKFLVSNGVSLSARDESGNTALHGAVRDFDQQAITTLLAAGANAKAVNAKGRTPLHELRSASYGRLSKPQPTELEKARNALVAAGADPLHETESLAQ